MMPSEMSAWAVEATTSSARAKTRTHLFMSSLLSSPSGQGPSRRDRGEGLHPEVFVQFVPTRRQDGVGHHVHHPTVLHHVVTVGHRRGEPEVLLDEQNRETLRLEPPDGGPDLLDDHRRQALRRLVEQEQPGARAQNATN